MQTQIVISASRRTDIPAFYMDWFMERIKAGFFTVTNPYNLKTSLIPATADKVHTIVFWSKDFSRFIAGNYGQRLIQEGYHLFFNFTINSQSKLLEPNIPPLENRLEQAAWLCEKFGADSVQWRFDPICFFTFEGGPIQNNLEGFLFIASHLGSLGIARCVTSFMDHYAKIRKRTAAIPGFTFVDVSMDEKINVLMNMHSAIASLGMTLYICCEKEVMDNLPAGRGIEASSCISNRLLVDLFGGHLSFKKDYGQRVKQGCGCLESKDIGLYDLHPCHHNCLFCYANPSSDGKAGCK